MYKIIIVEDEPFVRRSIKLQIDWNAMGFVLVGEAGNGEEAIAMIEEHEPNVILCDIIMPIMDGLELLQYCKENDYKGKFVMLTCMNEFEYARQALKYGASEYILKLSMNKENLSEVLLKVRRELDHEQSERGAALFYEYKVMYETIWKGILEGHIGDVYNREDIPNHWDYVTVIASIKAEKLWLQEKFEENFLEGKVAGSYFHTFDASGVLFGFYWSLQPVRYKRKLPIYPSETVVISPSVIRTRLEEQWKQVLHSLDKSWYDNKAGTYYAAKDDEYGPGLFPFSWDDERRWLEKFENMDELGWKRQGADVFNRFRELQTPVFVVKRIAERMDRAFQKIAGLDIESILRIDVLKLEYTTSHEECMDALLERMAAYQEWRMAYTVITTDHEEINKIIHLIHHQYDKQITLQSMANYVNMEAHYLSKLFKKKTGETLINYLQRQRVERAKRLLMETNNPVNEVGYLVGFANDNYFVKIFKRWTGVTPGAYRRSKNKT